MRPNKDKYFMEIAHVVSKRATCSRLQVGSVLVRDSQIISTGYNGSMAGRPHCIDSGCLVINGHCVNTIHSEMNAIIQAAKHGISTDGCTIYVTHIPCFNCMKAIVNAGIVKVKYASTYNDLVGEHPWEKYGYVQPPDMVVQIPY